MSIVSKNESLLFLKVLVVKVYSLMILHFPSNQHLSKSLIHFDSLKGGMGGSEWGWDYIEAFLSDGEYQHGSDGSLERNGYGVHTTTEGAVYEGEWKGDKMNGRGKLAHPSGALYEGEFVNNQFHGQGKYTWKNNSFYEGQFKENK